jgi:hypothetical protein
MKSKSQRWAVARFAVIFGILWTISFAKAAIAQTNVSSPLQINDGFSPQLVFNDTGAQPYIWNLFGDSGGFALTDGTTTMFSVDPGAPYSTLKLAGNGYIGIGTDWPQTKLHLAGVAPNTLRFETTNQGGFTLRTWDIQTDSSALAVIDSTSGSTTVPLSIQSGAPTNSFIINNSGQVSLGTGLIAQPARLTVGDLNHSAIGLISLDSQSNVLSTWELFSNAGAFTIYNTINGATFPFTIDIKSPSNSFVVKQAGIGLGTATPNTLGSANLQGQVLNLVSPNNHSNIVAQGMTGGYLMLAQANGAANHRIFQLRTAGGVSAFDVVADNLTSSVPNVLNFNMTNGFVGVGTPAISTKPLAMKSGAFCSTGGVWTNASSREVKQDIEPLTIEQAREAVQALNPIGFRYKEELDEHYLGFIAEDVPELVATNDRKSLAPMDITAVLTKVVQDQDAQIKLLTKRLDDLERQLTEKDSATN